jgi:hypothetical protein
VTALALAVAGPPQEEIVRVDDLRIAGARRRRGLDPVVDQEQ